MDKKEQIIDYCRQFRIAGMQRGLDEIISTAEKQNSGYIEFTFQLLDAESRHRQENDAKKTQKSSRTSKNK